MTLPERLWQARGKLSRRALAELIGYSPETIAKYEYGGIPKGIRFLEAFAKLRGISPTWLLLGKGPERLADALKPTPLDADCWPRSGRRSSAPMRRPARPPTSAASPPPPPASTTSSPRSRPTAARPA